MSIIKNLLMEKLTIEEKIEINAALHGRFKFMKETIAKLKKNGIDASYFEQCLSVCETLIEEDKVSKYYN